MKKLEFETSKGKFILVDSVGHENYYEIIRDWIDKGVNVELIALLKDITEQQVSEVVESALDSHLIEWYKNYGDNEEWEDEFIFMTAIESLHSLIKSKGWYLFENPFSGKIGIIEFDYHRNKADQKTFYNPYLFRVKNHIK